jgi:hypothetical protein
MTAAKEQEGKERDSSHTSEDGGRARQKRSEEAFSRSQSANQKRS